MRKFKRKIPIDKFLRFKSTGKSACNSSIKCFMKISSSISFSSPRGRAPFGQHQESRPLEGPIYRACTKNSFRILSHSDCQSWLWAWAEWRQVRERGLSVLDLPRGRDSWCWLKEKRPLGTRIVQSLHIENGSTTWLIRNLTFLISIRISSLINSTESIFLLFSTYIA